MRRNHKRKPWTKNEGEKQNKKTTTTKKKQQHNGKMIVTEVRKVKNGTFFGMYKESLHDRRPPV